MRKMWSVLLSLCLLGILSTGAIAAEVTIFTNENPNAVSNGPANPMTQFTLSSSTTITYIRTYHWFNGQGTSPGTITVKDQAGRPVLNSPTAIYNKYYWFVRPNLYLPAGTYSVSVSAPQTWSFNAASGGRGFLTVNADPALNDQKGRVDSRLPAANDAKGAVTSPFNN